MGYKTRQIQKSKAPFMMVVGDKEIESNSQKNGQTQIFIETPYRNSQMLKSIISVCSMDTNLCIATDLTLSNESIKTKTVGEWKKRPPDIHKRPTVFLLSRD